MRLTMVLALCLAALPAADGSRVKPESFEYAVKMQMGPQAMDMSVKRTIAEAMRDARKTLGEPGP